MPQSPLLIGMLIGVSAAAAGWLAFGGTNSNKTAPPKPQAQSSPVSQKKTVSTNNTSTLGASTNPASKPAPTPSYTSSLPTGFYLNNDAQNLGNGVITYSINDSNGNTYSVVQEPLPANSNATVFAQKLTDTETFTAPVGNAVIGDSGSELLAGVNAPNNTWIIIEAPNTSLRPQLEELVRSLRS
ncbi:MAG TPA: hypothetical protein VEH48_00055 [Candidatus Nitrosopolaris sp.]|nr:hypothetical protein [Candidatus Nitrosopolaris sp.]